MATEFQNYIKNTALERLNSRSTEESELSIEDKNSMLLEICSDIFSENGLEHKYTPLNINTGKGQAKIKCEGWYLDEETGDLFIYTSFILTTMKSN